MTKDDYKKFCECLLGCAEITDKPLTEQAIAVYWNALKHLEIQVVVDAFGRHVTNPDSGQFMPKPADIIRLCEGSHLDSAMQAWTKVVDAMKTVGSHSTVVFDDPLIMMVVKDMGGWVYLCQTTVKELPFKGNEFTNRYKGYKTTGRLDPPNKLTGRLEQECLVNGFSYGEKPVLIGDRNKAKAVLENNLSEFKQLPTKTA